MTICLEIAIIVTPTAHSQYKTFSFFLHHSSLAIITAVFTLSLLKSFTKEPQIDFKILSDNSARNFQKEELFLMKPDC